MKKWFFIYKIRERETINKKKRYEGLYCTYIFIPESLDTTMQESSLAYSHSEISLYIKIEIWLQVRWCYSCYC